MKSHLKSLWCARFFILNSIRNEFVSRVVRSRLGCVWILLNPLVQVAIYAFVLSVVLAAKLPGLDRPYAYPAFITAGILAWSLFSEVVTRSLTVFIDHAQLLKKMSFPRLALPLIVCGSALLNNALLFCSVLVIFSLLGHWPSEVIFWLPLVTVLVLFFAAGLGLLLGLLNVFVRDIGQLVTLGLQFGFWLTPVVYSSALINESHRFWLYLNPLAGLVEAYQSILVYQQSPNAWLLIYPFGVTLLLLFSTGFIYQRAIDDVVDVL